MTIELGPNINFIVGHNGSGKSAILTGISICLGGKASQTQRGSKLSAFIKDGCDFSIVTVTIDNSGENAFDPETFGDEILVERTIDKTSSHYKVKNSSGKTVSSKREILDNILHHYEIIIDNPMSILTQDAARSFLTSTSNAKIYRYLSEGIKHETWKAKNAEIISSNNDAQVSLKNYKAKLRTLGVIHDAAEKAYNARKTQADSAKNLHILKGKLAWKQVGNEEQRLAKHTAKFQQDEMNAFELDAKVEQLKAGAENFEESRRLLNEELEVEAAKVQAVRAELSVVDQKKTELRNNHMEVERDQRSIKAQVREYDGNLSQLRIALENEEKNLDGGYDQKKRELKENLEKRTAQFQSVKVKLEKAEETVRRLRPQKDEFEPKIEETRTDISHYGMEIQNLNKNIKSFQNDEASKLAAYGNNTRRVLDDIERNASRFHEKPLGPIGRYVTLKNPDWSGVLNRMLSSTLLSFVVNNDEDKRVLFDILNRNRAQNAIIVTKKDLFNFEGNLPSSEFTTILDVLDISNEHIKRVLINYHKIESTILIPKRVEAENVMYRKPDKVTQCYALVNGLHGCIVGGGDRNSSGSTPIQAWEAAILMQSKGNDQIDQWKHRLRIAEESRLEVSKKQKELLRQSQEITKEIEMQGKAIVQYRDRRKQFQRDIDSIEAQLSEEVDMTRLNTLKVELEECEENKRNYDQQYTDSIILNQRTDEDIRKLEQEAHIILKRISAAERDHKVVSAKIHNLRAAELKLESNVNAGKQQAGVFRDSARQEQQKMREAQSAIEEAIRTAERFEAVRVTTDESMERLFEQIKILREKVKAHDNAHSKSLEEVASEYHTAQSQFAETKQKLQEHRQIVKKLCEMQVQHERRYAHFLRLTTVGISNEFSRILRERDFEGKLIIDHNNQQISIQAAPKKATLEGGGGGGGGGVDEKPRHLQLQQQQQQKKKDAAGQVKDEKKVGRDPRSLSGGEKSFSQIAFLLAVWKAMGSKIRGLDEFDVFMDEVNRKVSMKLMIEAVKDSSNVQTIFITPNNMADMNVKDDDVRIHLMADPR